MNAGAIALAADSAATATTSLGDAKVFSSEDKIFALTESAMVGIMTFGDADYMGIPFETVVSEYRRRHGSRTYAQLEEYGEALLLFMRDEIGPRVQTEKQQAFILDTARELISEMAETIERRRSNLRILLVDEDEDIAQDIWATEEASLIGEITEEYRDNLGEAEPVAGMGGEVLREMELLLDSHVDEILGELTRLDLRAEETEQLFQIVRQGLPVMTEDISHQGGDYVGIVVTGFGDEDLFPSYCEYHVEGLYRGVLKCRTSRKHLIEDAYDSEIRPFAQTEMINAFLFGIRPNLWQQLFGLVRDNLENYSGELLANLDRYSEREKESILDGLEPSFEMVADSFVRDVFERRAAEQNYDEIKDVVSFMPKEQLAEMAEALVGITSLRRRASFDDETVGGPTDVAVITKGDGLVWIKRKQYFDSGLNPDYLARISRTGVTK